MLSFLASAVLPAKIDALEILAAPYQTAAEVERAWEPATRLLEDQIQRKGSLADLVPKDFPKFSFLLSDSPLQSARPSHLVSLVVTGRDSGTSRSRNLLFYWHRGILRHQALESEISFPPSRLYYGSGLIEGGLALLTGTAIGNEPSPGRAVAAALRYSGNRWRLIAKRASFETGHATAVRGKSPYVDANTFISRTNAIRYYDSAPALEFHQAWRLQNGRFATAYRVQVKNAFWAMDGLVHALRSGDESGARRFCIGPQVVTDAERIGFGNPKIVWSAYDEADGNGERRIQLNGHDGEKSIAASFGFERRGNRTLIANLRGY